jgi:tetratricopeptide (TPR) repeat protein
LLALDEREGAQALAQDACEMAEALGLMELAARALGTRGLSKSFVFDFAGAVADLERSVELSRSVSSPEEVRGVHNLGSTAWFSGDLTGATALFTEATSVGERYGTLKMALASRSVLCGTLYPTGHWKEALELADELIALLASAGASYFEYHTRVARSRISLARDDEELALADARRAMEVSRSAKDRQVLFPVLSNMVFVATELGRDDEAREAKAELIELLPGVSRVNIHRTIDAAWHGRGEDLGDALRRLALTTPDDHLWGKAVLAILDADDAGAAAALGELGHVDEGYACMRAGERELDVGHRLEGEAQLRRTIEIFGPLGATRYVRRAEELMVGAGLEIPA